MSGPASSQSSRALWVGWAVMIALIAIVAGVLFQARAQPTGTEPPRPPAPSETDARGFRRDAWFLPDDHLLGFVEIPAGPFTMGSDPAKDPLAFDNERWSPAAAQGTVDLPAFYIGRYEVTVAQFGAFVTATGHRADEQALRGAGNHPVAAVTWPEALAYCRWLETSLQSSPHTPARLQELLRQGWRVVLPSEAQWEKAARGADGRIYPWGREPRTDRANFGGSAPMPVGSFPCPECPYPVADLSGNVWEWTRSPYQPYPYDPADDRTGLAADALWVMRGGSFADAARTVRAAVRGGADPGARRPFIGFRVVLAPIR